DVYQLVIAAHSLHDALPICQQYFLDGRRYLRAVDLKQRIAGANEHTLGVGVQLFNPAGDTQVYIMDARLCLPQVPHGAYRSQHRDRKSTRMNSSHVKNSYAV